MRDWWDMSKRLRWHIMTSPTIYGYKWIAESGNWKVLIVRLRDAYRQE